VSDDPRTDAGPEGTEHSLDVLDLLVYAPTGLVLTALEDLPELAARGRTSVERQLRTAKAVGQLAVTFGRRDLQGRLERLVGGRGGQRATGGPTTTVAAPPATDERAVPDPTATEAPGSPDQGAVPDPTAPAPWHPATPADAPATEAPVAPLLGTRSRPVPAAPRATAGQADLAIPGYDTLSASQVVRRLEGLGRSELETVSRYEAATRNRRTILHRADQLLSAEPDAGGEPGATEPPA